MDRPIPAFYCCYLLRSTVRHAALYVGSTPNPPRRLKQHNGGVQKGGAKRTDRDTLRPWEMVCLVTGFPSKIAALQFEWAWQNTHLTRHIPASERLTQLRTVTRVSPRSGKKRTKILKPPMSITDKISNLHVLLRVESFKRWPLAVRFFAEDVYRVWTVWGQRMPARLRDGMEVALEKPPPPPLAGEGEVQAPHGAAAIDATYLPMKPVLERSRDLLHGPLRHECSVCQEPIDKAKELLMVCPTTGCQATSHPVCLSRDFIANGSATDAVLPTVGRCRNCGESLQWTELARDLSLRLRGQSVLDAVFKSSRSKNGAVKLGPESAASDKALEAEERRLSGLIDFAEDEEEETVADMPGLVISRRRSAVEEAEDENSWLFQECDVDDDVMGWNPEQPVGESNAPSAGGVVLDSDDWGDAEVVR